MDELHHRLLLQSDRLLQVLEELTILGLCHNFGLFFFHEARLNFLYVLVIVVEARLKVLHLIRDQSKTVFQLLLHQLDMSLHHVS